MVATKKQSALRLQDVKKIEGLKVCLFDISINNQTAISMWQF